MEPDLMKSSNTNEELAYFDECLHAATKYLEFGSGNSTTRAVKQEGLQIISVESDSEYLDDFKIFISTITKKSLSLEFIHADIGPTEELGYPEESTEKAILLNYTNWVWDKLKFKSFIPDLILIDGRFRVACCLKCFDKINQDCFIIFDDFLNRPQYHIVLDYYEIIEKTIDNTMVVLQKKSHIKNIPDELIEKYELNPE